LVHTVDNDLFAIEMWTVQMLENSRYKNKYFDSSRLYHKFSVSKICNTLKYHFGVLLLASYLLKTFVHIFIYIV